MESSVLYYAVASWGRSPYVPSGSRSFSYHKQNAYAATMYALLLAACAELIAVHFVARVFFPRAALALLAISLWGAIWVLGFARSVQFRPILLSAHEILVRNGTMWSLDISRTQIERIEFGRVIAPAKGTPGYFRAAPGQPNVLIELRQPACARGSYGIQRMVTRVGLVIDDLAAFERGYAEI
jgi:hypothetical protein